MKKALLVSLGLLAIFLFFLAVQIIIFSDKRFRIVFCDVGQGDAILIISPSGIVSVYDGGPDESVVACLSNHLPFWQRTIALLLVSHPHADHYIGMLSVLDRYKVASFATEQLQNDTVLYKALFDRIKTYNIPFRYLFVGDVYRFRDGMRISVLGPTKEYLKKTSPNGKIGERQEFASLILLVTYKEFSMLLTGDSQVSGLEEAAKRLPLRSVSILHVPHHGSKTGLNEKILERLKPELAVISVGKNNYGHPSPFITNLLRAKGIEQRETVKEGDIEIRTDGKGFLVK